jgi:hypothetical protein
VKTAVSTAPPEKARSLPEWEGVGDGSIAPIKRCAWRAALAVGGCIGDTRSSASRIVSRDLRSAGKVRLVWRHAAQRRYGLNPDEQHDDEYRDRPGRENTAPVTEILIPAFLFSCLLHALRHSYTCLLHVTCGGNCGSINYCS